VAQDKNGQNWAQELVRRAGLAAKAARGNLSASRLSDRTAELGMRISPSVIAKLDSGHRGGVLSVAELLVLAAALELPPVALLVPDALEDVEILPDKSIPGLTAVGWLTGAGFSVGLDYNLHVPDGVRTSDAMRIPLRLLQVEASLAQQRYSLLQSEGGLDALEMSDAMRQNEIERTELTRNRIKLLEDERDRLVTEYRDAVEGEGAQE
jgi:hypothetical protein